MLDLLSREHGYTDRPPWADHRDVLHQPVARHGGCAGLTGISAQIGKVVRPLMFASRKRDSRIRRPAPGIPSGRIRRNRSTKYLRNKIRLGLIPASGRSTQIHPDAPQPRGSPTRSCSSTTASNASAERPSRAATESTRSVPSASTRPSRASSSSTSCSARPTASRATRSMRCAAPWSRTPRESASTPATAWPRSTAERPRGSDRPDDDCLTTVRQGALRDCKLGALLRIPLR